MTRQMWRLKKKANVRALVSPPHGRAAKLVTAIRKGAAVVDPLCPNGGGMVVLDGPDGPYDALLNQTNIANNNNKFYICQALKSEVAAQVTSFYF